MPSKSALTYPVFSKAITSHQSICQDRLVYAVITFKDSLLSNVFGYWWACVISAILTLPDWWSLSLLENYNSSNSRLQCGTSLVKCFQQAVAQVMTSWAEQVYSAGPISWVKKSIIFQCQMLEQNQLSDIRSKILYNQNYWFLLKY